MRGSPRPRDAPSNRSAARGGPALRGHGSGLGHPTSGHATGVSQAGRVLSRPPRLFLRPQWTPSVRTPPSCLGCSPWGSVCPHQAQVASAAGHSPAGLCCPHQAPGSAVPKLTHSRKFWTVRLDLPDWGSEGSPDSVRSLPCSTSGTTHSQLQRAWLSLPNDEEALVQRDGGEVKHGGEHCLCRGERETLPEMLRNAPPRHPAPPTRHVFSTNTVTSALSASLQSL